MSIPTFNPPIAPSPGTYKKAQPKVLRAEFGDGYTQATRAGLNHIKRTISMQWDALTLSQAMVILNFFEQRAGTDPFYYQMSTESYPTKWICTDWTYNFLSNNNLSISANFTQDFSL